MGDFRINNGVLEKYTGAGGDVKIPQGVTSIGDSAFEDCSELTSIVIPASVTSIGADAFHSCRNLASIVIPASVTSIGADAFHSCWNLASIVIPNSVSSIRYGTFSHCTILTNIVIPDSVTDIGEGAFEDCMNLTSIVIPNSVTKIGTYAFKGCISLASIVIPASVTSIGAYAFDSCRNLASIVIPNSVSSIWYGTFSHCIQLTNIIIPDSVTRIGDYAFYDCTRLTNIVIPDSVTDIGEGAFEDCMSLTSIVIPEGITHIDKFTFRGCTSLTSIIVKNPKCIFQIDSIESDNWALVISLIPYFTDSGFKYYVLNENVWENLDDCVRYKLFLTHQGKSITPAYKEVISEVEVEPLGQYILTQMKESNSSASSKAAVAYLDLFTHEAPVSMLQSLNEQLKKQKGVARLMKDLKNNYLLQEKLGTAGPSDGNEDPLEKMATELIVKRNLSPKVIESNVQKYYGIKVNDLPAIRKKDGTSVPSIIKALLLTVHEELKKDRWGDSYLAPQYELPGQCPEAESIVGQLDPQAFQEALLQLADKFLGMPGVSKKMLLAYPICRYADEATMAELTKRAPKWRSSVSGDDAPPFRTFREASVYSNTRSAMLFDDRYHMLGRYAALRGTDEQTVRDTMLSDIGLDAKGTKTYDLGNQTVIIRMKRDLSFIVELPGGKTSKSLPKKGADPDRYEKANADFSDIKKASKKIIKNRISILFEQFLSGEGRDGARWHASYLNNPLLRHVASLLVWEQGSQFFTLSDKGAVDATGNAVELTNDQILVAHPMEMPENEIKAWQNYFLQNNLKQPFEQIWEPVYKPEEISHERYKECMIPYYRLMNQKKHGIIVTDEDFHNLIEIWIQDCDIEYAQHDLRRHDIRPEDRFEITHFGFGTYTRRVNHIVAYLDRVTVWERVKKDDVSIEKQLTSFTLAQILEFIKEATEVNANNVLALLLQYRNEKYPNYDNEDELTLDW